MTAPLADLDALVLEAQRRAASLLLLVPHEPPTWRIQGGLVRGEGAPLAPADVERLAVAAIGEARLAEVGRTTGVAWAALNVGEVAAGVSVSRAGGLPTIAVHVHGHPTFDPVALGLPPALLRAAEAGHGLIVISGPSGSGKTTTAYALLEHLNRTTAAHLVTVEDPVELKLEPKRALIQQRQVGLDVPSFLAGIGAARMQDLDVLFVGEVRAVDVLQASLITAETGHLVILLLHQPTPELAIQRMLEVQPPETREAFRRALARVLVAVCAQHLLPRADGPGRALAAGLLLPDAGVRAAIAEGPLPPTSPWPGSPALPDALAALVAAGRVAPASAEAVRALAR